MRVKLGDSVVLMKESSRPAGIVERRSGTLLMVRVPDSDISHGLLRGWLGRAPYSR